jgi:branched-subunit amino acid aminotransferase/4-amino-4-deoxychorismate lyase
MSTTASLYRWHDGALEYLDYCDMAETEIVVADSWLVTNGRTLALGLHRSRFLSDVPAALLDDAQKFWDAAIAEIPREGDWFPRVELQSRSGALLFVFRLRSAPERQVSAVLSTWTGADPRTQPRVKGPDLDRMLQLRTEAQHRGATEMALLSPDGFVVEGAYSSIVWWRGAILCAPPEEFARVDSVTARSLFGLAAALGVETFAEPVTPAELEGTEVWALNALHGIRIVTSWVDGPALAELPGRVRLWRDKLGALRHPLPSQA